MLKAGLPEIEIGFLYLSLSSFPVFLDRVRALRPGRVFKMARELAEEVREDRRRIDNPDGKLGRVWAVWREGEYNLEGLIGFEV
jgi:hypothetical protein